MQPNLPTAYVISKLAGKDNFSFDRCLNVVMEEFYPQGPDLVHFDGFKMINKLKGRFENIPEQGQMNIIRATYALAFPDLNLLADQQRLENFTNTVCSQFLYIAHRHLNKQISCNHPDLRVDRLPEAAGTNFTFLKLAEKHNWDRRQTAYHIGYPSYMGTGLPVQWVENVLSPEKFNQIFEIYTKRICDLILCGDKRSMREVGKDWSDFADLNKLWFNLVTFQANKLYLKENDFIFEVDAGTAKYR
jgi:hypothetical protein